LTLIIHIKR